MTKKINLARFLREEKVKKIDWVIFTIEPFAELAQESTDQELGEFFRSFISDLVQQNGNGSELAEALLDESRRYIDGKSKGGKASGEARARQAEERRKREQEIAENEQCLNGVEQCSNKNEQCLNGGANYNSNSNSNSSKSSNKTNNIVVADALVNFPFSEFWDRYPNKKGRATAEKTWKRMSEEDRRLAIDAIPAYRKSVDPRYLKHGSSYLNQKVWLDDLTPTQTNGLQTNGKTFRQIDKQNSSEAWKDVVAHAVSEQSKIETIDQKIERYRQQ